MRQSVRIALLAVFAATASSQRALGEGTLVTDPELLSRMGFAAEARNVYIVEPAARGQSPAAPEEFGTFDFGHTTVLGNQHIARASSTYGTVSGFGDIYLVSGDLFYDALLDMPSGARLSSLEWLGFDDSAADMTLFLIRGCQTGPGPPTLTVLFSVTTDFVVPGGEFLVALPPDESVTIDNQACTYIARTRSEQHRAICA